jgi:L-ribulose-5-phosphate 3-epimerase UlaE
MKTKFIIKLFDFSIKILQFLHRKFDFSLAFNIYNGNFQNDYKIEIKAKTLFNTFVNCLITPITSYLIYLMFLIFPKPLSLYVYFFDIDWEIYVNSELFIRLFHYYKKLEVVKRKDGVFYELYFYVGNIKFRHLFLNSEANEILSKIKAKVRNYNQINPEDGIKNPDCTINKI